MLSVGEETFSSDSRFRVKMEDVSTNDNDKKKEQKELWILEVRVFFYCLTSFNILRSFGGERTQRKQFSHSTKLPVQQ